MAGKWGVNVIFGLMGSLLTFLFSFSNNTWQTSMVRSGIGFLIFFVLGYLLHYILRQISAAKTSEPKEDRKRHEEIKRTDDQTVFSEEKTEADSSFQAISLHSLHQGEDKSSN
jgi:amino acid permease